MHHGNEQIQVDFHNEAKTIFFSRFTSFAEETKRLNRKTGEFQFQEYKNKYIHSLKQDLELVAQRILQNHAVNPQTQEAGPLFQQFIADYLHRFVQKVNAL